MQHGRGRMDCKIVGQTSRGYARASAQQANDGPSSRTKRRTPVGRRSVSSRSCLGISSVSHDSRRLARPNPGDVTPRTARTRNRGELFRCNGHTHVSRVITFYDLSDSRRVRRVSIVRGAHRRYCHRTILLGVGRPGRGVKSTRVHGAVIRRIRACRTLQKRRRLK